jgi:enoyl-CoA hydratase
MASQGATIRMVERAGWGNAQRYLLTGEEFDAWEAHRPGFVQEVVSADNLTDRAIAIAEIVAQQAPLAIKASLVSSGQYLEFGFAAAAGGLATAQAALARSEDA